MFTQNKMLDFSMANTKISAIANCLHPLVFFFLKKFFFRLCCKELNFPRVVSKGDAEEMSIFSDERRVNCATLLAQTLECLLNVPPKTHTCTFSRARPYVHRDKRTRDKQTGRNSSACDFNAGSAGVKPRGKVQI